MTSDKFLIFISALFSYQQAAVCLEVSGIIMKNVLPVRLTWLSIGLKQQTAFGKLSYFQMTNG